VHGLQYVSDELPGIRRVKRGRGFQYVAPNGNGGAVDRDRIISLAIPPAWTDVWISPDPNGHIQATGRDAKGRKQYRYHPHWRKARDRDKYRRLAAFGSALPDVRRHVDAQLEAGGALDVDRVVALVIALLDETLIRIGNPEYVENGSHGLTTLTARHVQWGRGELTFCFPGKSGKRHEVDVEDPRLARLVRRCHQLGGQQLFTYRDASGNLGCVTSSDVNDTLRAVTELDVTAKDFRTWGGTTVVTEHLAQAAPAPDDDVVLAAIDAAAAQLGNTRAVCRASYVHPAVVGAAASGHLQEVWAASRARRYLRRAEVALLDVIGG
jgi:DNA topoisomerase-1